MVVLANSRTMQRYDTLVRKVLSSTLGIESGDDVIVETWDHGLSIADAFVYGLREIGARPMLLFEHEDVYWRSTESLPEEKLGKVGDHEWAAIEKAKGYVFIPGPADFLRLLRNRSKYSASTGYNSEWYERAKRYHLKGARIGLGYATQQRAKAYRFSLAAWQRMLTAASTVDFAVLKEKISKLASLMRSGEVKVTAPNGTNLTLRLAGRDAYRDDCIVDAEDLDLGRNVANIPGGQILACPDETYGEGTVIFDRPTPFMGKWYGPVRFDFKDGMLTDCKVRLNAKQFKERYEKATGEKNRIGAIGVGVNPMARVGFLQDGLVSGVVTVGVGQNDDAGGANTGDFYFGGILTKATLTVNGTTIVQNGQLSLPESPG
jgi:aminopeptidase